MIIFRYIARDLLGTTAAVCAVLMLVIISGRFVKYLAQAAAGMLDANILFAVIGYRLPGFLELILPLAFFLGILLVYGRLYVDSEMTVLYACGMSPNTLIAYTMAVAVLVAGVVAWLSFSVSPGGLAKAEALLSAQKSRGEFESLEGGKFYPLRGGRGVTYTESIDDDGNVANGKEKPLSATQLHNARINDAKATLDRAKKEENYDLASDIYDFAKKEGFIQVCDYYDRLFDGSNTTEGM